jgi:hypothetical protein
MDFGSEDKSGKQFRCDARRVRYDRGAQVFFENKDLARDFAEFADIMSVLLKPESSGATVRRAGTWPIWPTAETICLGRSRSYELTGK